MPSVFEPFWAVFLSARAWRMTNCILIQVVKSTKNSFAFALLRASSRGNRFEFNGRGGGIGWIWNCQCAKSQTAARRSVRHSKFRTRLCPHWWRSLFWQFVWCATGGHNGYHLVGCDSDRGTQSNSPLMRHSSICDAFVCCFCTTRFLKESCKSPL